jgi:hypothetical protein
MKYIILIAFLCLTACKSTPALVGKGLPKANLIDTFEQNHKIDSAKFFIADKVNHIRIPNARGRSLDRSNGQGANLLLTGVERDIPIYLTSVNLVAELVHARPIDYIFANLDNSFIKGVVKFRPKEGLNYLVKGHISADYTAVWIEDENGEIVTDLIEGIGSDKALAQKEKNRIFDLRQPKIEDKKKHILNQVSQGEPLHLVEKKFGKKGTTLDSGRNFKLIRFEGIGTIRFGCFYNHSCFTHKKIKIIRSDKKRLQEIEKFIAVLSPKELRFGLREFLEFDLSSTAVMDIFAAKLWKIHHTDKSHLVKASVVLCRMIGSSGYNRYRNLLRSITQSENTVDGDLIEQAHKSLLLLTRGDDVQYIGS